MKPMTTRIIRCVPVVALPTGNYGSFPAEVGLTAPLVPTAELKVYSHPQDMSLTTGEVLRGREPENGATLALGCPPES